MTDSYHDHQIDKHHPRNQFKGFPIISDQISREGIGVVYRELETILAQGVAGAIVEFGCYIGTTSLFIRRLLDATNGSAAHPFHVYDSFEGLPAKGHYDNNAASVDFEAGKLYASKKELLQQFKNANLQPPIIHKGWFNELPAWEVPQQIAFAFLDGDFYESIISSLRVVYPCMNDNGRILIDDYKRETLPGVERAIRDFFQGKQLKRLHAEHNIAIIEV